MEQIENNEISIREIILKIKKVNKYLFSKKKNILFFSLIGAILGVVYSVLQNPVYTASTTFVLKDGGAGGGLGQYASLASAVGINLGGGGDGGLFQGDNILELYQSRNMLQKTLLSEVKYNGKKKLLIDQYIDFNKLRKSWEDKPQLKNIRFDIKSGQQLTRVQDSIISRVVSDLNKDYLIVSRPDAKLDILQVDVKATDEFFAKTFNDILVKNVNDFYVQTKTKKSLQNLSILQHQTDSITKEFKGAMYKTAAASDAVPNINAARQILRVPVQRSQFDIEINKAILIQLVQNLEIAKLTLRQETPLVQNIDVPIYPLPKEKLGKIKGVLIGAFLFGFLTSIFLIIKKYFDNVSAN